MAQPDALLEIADLSLQLRGERPFIALQGLSLSVCPRETLALLGESGCGKSLTALAIMRLLPPAARILSGAVRLGGRDLLALQERDMRRLRGGRIGMIFQEPMTALNPVASIGSQLLEALRLHQPELPDFNAEAVRLLQSVGIPDAASRLAGYPHQLSGGMKQRVMIAMALAGRPELLIADEPTTALDVTIQAQVLQVIADLQKERGMAVLLITHDLGVVAENADRLAVMYAGELVELAESDRFFRHPRHPYSRKLLDAVPGFHSRGQGLSLIPGTVPRLDRAFAGCRFAGRCDQVMELCRQQQPAWQVLADGSQVRCHLYRQTDVPAAAGKPVRSPVVAAATPARSQRLLRAEELRVHFPIRKGVLQRAVGAVRAVDGVSLHIAAGETLALVGESGCGKTTVGKALLRLLPLTAGRIWLNELEWSGLPPRQLRSHRSQAQIIFQDPFASMNPRMLVSEILAEGLDLKQPLRDAYQRQLRLKELLQQAGMPEDALERYPHEFSGGQRQRLCIARALAVAPRLLVLDEPTSALDVSVQAQILNLLAQLQQRHQMAYLFITHDLSVVSHLADRVAVMYLGRIVESGSVQQVLHEPLHPYTRALLAAVPRIAERRAGKILLQGDLPSPASPPAGCHFHPRCDKAVDACRAQYPPMRQWQDGRQTRCHLYG